MERKRRSMSDQFEMGKMSARLDVGDQRHVENIKRLEAIETTLKELVSALAMTKGGFRVLLAVGGVSASVGAAIASLFHWHAS